MGKSKKIILLVVEGVADEAALGPLLSKIMQREEVLVKICDGDLTSKIYRSTTQNVTSEVGRKVNDFLGRNKLKKTDLHQIIHIVDTDGAYVGEEKIFETSEREFQYLEEGITTDKKEKVILRNKNKSLAMDTLVGKSTMMGISYGVYYMSCNLDHVLYDKRNLEDRNKFDMADDFADKYLDDIENFITFINASNLIFQGGYKDTWMKIRQENNSLKRHSNIHIAINEYM